MLNGNYRIPEASKSGGGMVGLIQIMLAPKPGNRPDINQVRDFLLFFWGEGVNIARSDMEEWFFLRYEEKVNNAQERFFFLGFFFF